MNTIIINCHRAPNLFSSLLSYFCTSTHSTARLTLMKCIGEAVRCWDGDYISGKNDDIVNIVLNGVKDRSGDVRDVSRIVLCYLYLRSLPSAPSSSELTEIERISAIPIIPSVSSILTQLLSSSSSSQPSLSNAALELIRSDLRDFHAVRFPVSPFHSVTAGLRLFCRSPCRGRSLLAPRRPASFVRVRPLRSRFVSAAWRRPPSKPRVESRSRRSPRRSASRR